MDSNLRCAICGSALYNTDQSLSEFIYHCSSPAAKFWDYDRGTVEQIQAKEHWDNSKQEIPNRVKNTTP